MYIHTDTYKHTHINMYHTHTTHAHTYLEKKKKQQFRTISLAVSRRMRTRCNTFCSLPGKWQSQLLTS